jgi:hypothetical protein
VSRLRRSARHNRAAGLPLDLRPGLLRPVPLQGPTQHRVRRPSPVSIRWVAPSSPTRAPAHLRTANRPVQVFRRPRADSAPLPADRPQADLGHLPAGHLPADSDRLPADRLPADSDRLPVDSGRGRVGRLLADLAVPLPEALLPADSEALLPADSEALHLEGSAGHLLPADSVLPPAVPRRDLVPAGRLPGLAMVPVEVPLVYRDVWEPTDPLEKSGTRSWCS